jgi:endonuclease YncB( thermonuclease family)
MGGSSSKFKKTLQKELQYITYNDCTPFIPPITFGKVVKVYDGDTITIASKLPKHSQTYRFSVRVNGIDCPEIRTKNNQEKEIAIIARDKLSQLILHQYVSLENVKTEKYGRILADVIYNDINISEYLISQRLAIPYNGGRKEEFDWSSYYQSNIENGKSVTL